MKLMHPDPPKMGSSPPDSFVELMARLRADDQDAATVVYRKFIHRLIGLAREQFDESVRARADYEDVVQSVFKSFFARQRAGQFDLGDWDALWGLLVAITLRKCGRRRVFLRARRRDAAREVRAGKGGEFAWDAVDREPTPVEAAVLTETVAEWLGDLKASERTIMELYLQGLSVADVAEQLNRSERTVRRVRQHVEARLLERVEERASRP
jgi:RNA polymerase sigma-70 factor, ECF subfamily